MDQFDVPLICDPVPGPGDHGVLVCDRQLTTAEIERLRAAFDAAQHRGGCMVLPNGVRMVSVFQPKQWPDAEYCAA